MRTTAVLSAAALALAGCAGVAHAQASGASNAASGAVGLDGWYTCSEHTFLDEGSSPVDAECAVYNAPLCYPGVCDDTNGATVDIFVKRILASADPESKPNVWFLQGGPGEGSTAMEGFMALLRSYLAEEVNVYTMDHRGTGRSTLLDCTSAQAGTTGSPNGSTISVDEVPNCAASLEAKYGSDLAAFSTTSAATDLYTLISSFTPGQTTFVYGVSYGTALVERLMHLDPPMVSGYILDGIATASGSDLSKFENYSQWNPDLGEVGDRFLAMCADDEICGSKFPTTSLPDTLTALMESFDSDPSSTCAALLQNVTIDGSPPSYGLRIMFSSLLSSAESRTLIPVLAYRLNRCSELDVPVLTQFFTQSGSAAASQDAAFHSELLYKLIVYSEMWESPVPSRADMIDRFTLHTMGSAGFPDLVAQYCAFSKEDSDVCNELSVGDYPASSITYPRDQYWNVAATIPSQASVLILSSLLDPQTPHKYAEYLYEALNGTAKHLVTFKHATHATIGTTPMPDGSPVTCGLMLLGSFVIGGGDLAQLDQSCVDALPAISFDVPSSILYGQLGTADAYEGAYDAALSSPASGTAGVSSSSESADSKTSYKTVFIVFVVLFAIALVACAAFACGWYRLKQSQSHLSVDGEVVTPGA